MMRWLVPWLVAIISLGVSLALLGVAGALVADPYPRFDISDPDTVRSIVETNVAAVTAAIGVLIALVLLTVQFTAQRYSYDVIRIFIQSWINAALIGFSIVTISFNLWLGTLAHGDEIPVAGTILAVAMTTACFAFLPPYIVYLFDLLWPQNILNYLQRELLNAVDASKRSTDVARRQVAAYGRIDQITDIAMTAVNLSDSSVARHSIWVLYLATARYVEHKAGLGPEWFAVRDEWSEECDDLLVREIEETRTWLEWRMLDEVEQVFYATLNRKHEVSNLIARVARLLGEKAVECDDAGLLRTITKFFNTFLRQAINAGDVRTGYNVLYQYRRLADAALERYPELALEIADRLSYYGAAATGGPLLWMSAAAAHDLRILAENSHRRGVDRGIIAAIVADLLDTVGRAEAKESPALFQVYKTLVALGSFFLTRGELEFARQVRAGLAHAPAATLEQARRELAACENPVFWEVTDRVVNFDFVEPDVRAVLAAFVEEVEGWPTPAVAALRS
jgi:hypothetical protein